jgi:sugar lactone lactonase YvrE
MNDGACDPQGRFWAGSMAYDESKVAGSLYRMDLDGSVHRVLTGVGVSNGLGWSPDARTMYHADSGTYRITAYPFDPGDGSLGAGRTFVATEPAEGACDGLAVDDEGGVWTALWDGGVVRRYAPDGRLVTELLLPVSRPTACCFVGPTRDLLVITSAAAGLPPQRQRAEPDAGRLFGCRVAVTGPPAVAYAGSL